MMFYVRIESSKVFETSNKQNNLRFAEKKDFPEQNFIKYKLLYIIQQMPFKKTVKYGMKYQKVKLVYTLNTIANHSRTSNISKK